MQIFDTWAGILPADEFESWCIEPMRTDCRKGARAKFRKHRSSAFRAAPARSLAAISMQSRSMRSGSTGRSSLALRATQIQTRRPVQGNLDPLALLAGGAALDRSIDAILAAFSQRSVHFQSRPWRSAGHADRACRAPDRARPRQLTSPRAEDFGGSGGRTWTSTAGSRPSTSSR